MFTALKINAIALACCAVLFAGIGIAQAAPLLPDVNEATFSNPTKINNPWLSLPVGTKLEYEGDTEDGTEVVKIDISGATKKIMGVTTLVYRDRVYVDGELVEDTRDYLAQDDQGNVWYFGEDVDNYENGTLVDHDGSWIAGRRGAKPGYWMPAAPHVGDQYYQEYYKGKAEDQAEVVSLGVTVETDQTTYTGCLKTKDTTALEQGVVEYKYYCKQVAAQVLEENPADDERIELVSVTRPNGLSDDGEDEDDDHDKNEDGGSAEVAGLQQRLIARLYELLALLRTH